MKIEILERERAVLFVDGKPLRYLEPGVHRLVRPFQRVRVERFDTTALLVELSAEVLSLIPEADVKTVSVAEHERGLVLRRGRPVKWLGPGVHQLWTVDRLLDRSGASKGPEAVRGGGPKGQPAVTVQLLDTRAVQVLPLRDEVRALVPAADYVEATAPEGSVALRYVDGVLDAVLSSGRHAAWSTVHKVQLAVIDLRERLIHVNGQEVMTRDRVSLRLNLSVGFRVADARRLATVARSPDELVYLAAQLAAREAVSARTLDELLAERESLAAQLTGEVRRRAEALGLQLESFGVKDVILPGEMKALLNRVIEAQKEAEANVILRREETAATRSMAQTAKVLAENPILVRLKELEAYKELAAKVGQVHVVLGEGGVPLLQLKS